MDHFEDMETGARCRRLSGQRNCACHQSFLSPASYDDARIATDLFVATWWRHCHVAADIEYGCRMGFRLRRFISHVDIETSAVRLLIPDNTCWPAERAIRRPAAAYIDLQVSNVLSVAMTLCSYSSTVLCSRQCQVTRGHVIAYLPFILALNSAYSLRGL